MLTTLDMAQQLRVSIARLARTLRKQALGGLTPSQASVLSTLDTSGPLTMSALAEREGVSPPSATGIVNRMADRGLVERSANPSDQRSSLVAISGEGRGLLEQRRQEKTSYLAAEIEKLTAEDRETLARAVVILERLERPS